MIEAYRLIESDLILCEGLLDAALTVAIANREGTLKPGYDGATVLVNLLQERIAVIGRTLLSGK